MSTDLARFRSSKSINAKRIMINMQITSSARLRAPKSPPTPSVQFVGAPQ